ncbi:PAS domain S-box protein [Salinibaculum salinum]|uniref:PAS domain S-box protein n=1 Tax=Salinibaculum salinum TaxID=3131996 RepID=UPI0030EC49B8
MSSPDKVRLPPICRDCDRSLLLYDPETGAILDANESVEDLYGYSLDDLRTMDVGDFTASSTKFNQAEALRRIQAAANGDSQEFEWQIERVNSERRWIRVYLNSTSIDDQEFVVAEIDDITSYRERENRLRLLSRIIPLKVSSAGRRGRQVRQFVGRADPPTAQHDAVTWDGIRAPSRTL